MAIVLFLLQLAECHVAFAEQEWNEFLDAPGQAALVKVRAALAVGPGLCAEAGMPTGKQQGRLENMIESGSAWAVRAGLLIEPCLDGAYREDLETSLGSFFEHNPKEFFQLTGEWRVGCKFESMVTTLPLSLTDDFKAQADALARRIAAVEAINDPNMSGAKRFALEALRKELAARIREEQYH